MPVPRQPIERRPLPPEIAKTREQFAEDEAHNERILGPRIGLHLEVQRKLVAQMTANHARWSEETDLDPEADHPVAATWLLAGRCLALARAVTALLEQGFCTETVPTARALHEASRVLHLMRDSDDTEVFKRWRRGGGWTSPSKLNRAEAKQENRIGELAKRVGGVPPESVLKLTDEVYDFLSGHAHPKRTPILESWEPDLHRFNAGPERAILVRALWVGYGDEWVREAYQTVGLALTKFFPDAALGGRFWTTSVEAGLRYFEEAAERAPIDEGTLLGPGEGRDAARLE